MGYLATGDCCGRAAAATGVANFTLVIELQIKSFVTIWILPMV
mgnify:CR=1 FL=1